MHCASTAHVSSQTKQFETFARLSFASGSSTSATHLVHMLAQRQSNAQVHQLMACVPSCTSRCFFVTSASETLSVAGHSETSEDGKERGPSCTRKGETAYLRTENRPGVLAEEARRGQGTVPDTTHRHVLREPMSSFRAMQTATQQGEIWRQQPQQHHQRHVGQCVGEPSTRSRRARANWSATGGRRGTRGASRVPQKHNGSPEASSRGANGPPHLAGRVPSRY